MSERRLVQGGWIELYEHDGQGEAQCARCGSSVTHERCWNCGGAGNLELYDQDPLWYEPGDTERCEWCNGSGGWYRCLSSEDWCAAHPLPEWRDPEPAGGAA